MEFNLTKEQKKKMLIDSKNSIYPELYLLLVKIGIDPEEYTLGEDIGDDIKYAGEKVRLDALASSLQMIEKKISEFE